MDHGPQRESRGALHHDTDVIRFHAPCDQVVPNAVMVLECAHDHGCNFWKAQQAPTVTSGTVHIRSTPEFRASFAIRSSAYVVGHRLNSMRREAVVSTEGDNLERA